MEPIDRSELSNDELDSMLPEWQSPRAPARLRAALFPEKALSGKPRPWWRSIWTASIRVPLPVACALAILIALAVWRSLTPPPERVVVRTEQIRVPVVKHEIVTKTVYRDRIVHPAAAAPRLDTDQLQPVAELRPRIIRRQNAQN
jgi:hypothetical protein